MTDAQGTFGQRGRRHRWRLLTGYFFSQMPFWMLAPLLALKLAERGLEPAAVGVLTAAAPTGVLLALPLASVLTRRFGRRRTFLGATIVSVFGYAGFLLAGSPVAWALLAALAGWCSGIGYTLGGSWVAALAPTEGRGRAVAAYETVIGASAFAGPALLLVTGTEGRAPFAVAVSLALAGLVVAAFVPEGKDGEQWEQADPEQQFASVAAWTRLRVGPVLLGVAFVGGLFETGTTAVLPLYGLGVGLGATLAATLAATIGVGSLFQYQFAYLSERFGGRRVLIGAMASVTIGALLLPLAAAVPQLLWGLAFLWGAAGGGLFTLVVIRLASTLDGSALVSATATGAFAYVLGNAAGPALGGAALGWSPGYGLTALLGTAGLIGLVVLGVGSRHPRTYTADAEPSGSGSPDQTPDHRQ